jgi:hypothetical protein
MASASAAAAAAAAMPAACHRRGRGLGGEPALAPDPRQRARRARRRTRSRSARHAQQQRRARQDRPIGSRRHSAPARGVGGCPSGERQHPHVGGRPSADRLALVDPRDEVVTMSPAPARGRALVQTQHEAASLTREVDMTQ